MRELRGERRKPLRFGDGELGNGTITSRVIPEVARVTEKEFYAALEFTGTVLLWIVGFGLGVG